MPDGVAGDLPGIRVGCGRLILRVSKSAQIALQKTTQSLVMFA